MPVSLQPATSSQQARASIYRKKRAMARANTCRSVCRVDIHSPACGLVSPLGALAGCKPGDVAITSAGRIDCWTPSMHWIISFVSRYSVLCPAGDPQVDSKSAAKGKQSSESQPGSTVITAVRLSPTVGMDTCPIVYLKLVGNPSQACTKADPSGATDPKSNSLLSDSFAISCNTPINEVGFTQERLLQLCHPQWTVHAVIDL